MYQERRFWQHKPRSRGGVSHTATLKSSLELIHSARPAPTRPPRPTVPYPVPTRPRHTPAAFPGSSLRSRGTGASTAVECGGWGRSRGTLVAMAIGGPTTGHGHRSLPPSIHRQACQIDELMIVIPSDPGPHWLRPRALDPLVSSRRGSHHSKSFGARHQRKEREEKTAKSFQGLSSETEREKCD